jgi:hypothetical protein
MINVSYTTITGIEDDHKSIQEQKGKTINMNISICNLVKQRYDTGILPQLDNILRSIL